MCNEASPVLPKIVIPPQKLTAAEIANPHQVIYELFDFAHLPRIRELLWEFFKTAVIGNYTHDLQRRERELLVTMYEKIEKLVEAAHIIHEKQKQSIKPVFETYQFLPENVESANLERLIKDYQVNVWYEKMMAMVETIIRVTNAEKLFWSGFTINNRNKPQFDFVVLLPANAKYSYNDYLTQVQAKCCEAGSVLIWCTKINEVSKHLKEGHIFYSAACASELVVYDNKRLLLPKKEKIDIPAIKVKARNTFNDAFCNARSFLDGAEYFVTTDQYKPAVFLLHQATEHALRAILVSLTSLTTYGHNLKPLIRYSSFCAPVLDSIFPRNSEEEKELFNLLNTAYVSARYSANYDISLEQVGILLDRVNSILSQTEQSFEESLKKLETLLSAENK